MKRALFLLFIILLTASPIPAEENSASSDQYDYARDYRYSELIQKIRFQRNTLYNVLGLSEEQQELKDEIEYRRKEETKPYIEAFQCEQRKLRALAKTSYKSQEYKKQEKITLKAWKKMQKQFKKYDKEFMKILCSTQKAKYKEIVKLTRREIRYCYLNRKACPKDPFVNTFGKDDAKEFCEVCDEHGRTHWFNRECKTKEAQPKEEK